MVLIGKEIAFSQMFKWDFAAFTFAISCMVKLPEGCEGLFFCINSIFTLFASCACCCVHAYMHNCVGYLSALAFFDSNPFLYTDLIYHCTPSGQEFLHCCDVVREYSKEVIIKRRKELMEVLYY